MGFRRGLLPVLFAIVALVLTMHRASAEDHAVAIPSMAVVHVDAHHQQDSQHPVHSIGCCSIAIAVAGPEYGAVFYGQLRTQFALQASDVTVDPGFRSEHFRPPRVV